MLSEAAIEQRYKINTLMFIFLPHPSTTEALWQGHTKTIKLKFALFCHKVFEKGVYVWVNIREKLCNCHKLSIGWLLWGLVILTFTKIGACFFLVWAPSISVALRNSAIINYWSLITPSLFIVNWTEETYLIRVSFTDWHRFHYKPLCYFASSLRKLDR